MWTRVGAVLTVVLFALTVWPDAARGPLAPGGRVWLHAHNCYPDAGRGVDRLWRAVGAARGPVAIEQDLVWDPARQASVVAHGLPVNGAEPTLADHFFATLAPLLDRALADGRTTTWPVMVLHLDFKTNEPAHHEAVWQLLQAHARWLTTAPRTADPDEVRPLTPGPLLVLTEAGAGQEARFHDAVRVGDRLLVFGTVPPRPLPEAATAAARAAAAVAAHPRDLIPLPATNYRRWTNHSWAVVEAGGPPQAGAWTAVDRRRLEALTARAHAAGLWIRFYTLNGHAANDEGWSDGYNFGGVEPAGVRWRAAIDAGVDFVATDQYEAFAEALRRR